VPKLRKVTAEQYGNILNAEDHIRHAVRLLRLGGARKAAQKVAAAKKSVAGAANHAFRCRMRQAREGEQ
jgi:hypothetical protein